MDPKALERALNKAYPNKSCAFCVKEFEYQMSLYANPELTIKIEAYANDPKATDWFCDSLDQFNKRYQKQIRQIQYDMQHFGGGIQMRATLNLVGY